MKLTVRNFGPIREADIDVGPMTVFVGPSNTGKSYLAILIYAIMRVLDTQGKSYLASEKIVDEIAHEIRRDEKSKFNEIIKDISENDNWGEISQKIKKEGNSVVEHCFLCWEKIVTETIKKQIIYCFGEAGKRMLEDGENLAVSVTGPQNKLTVNISASQDSKLDDHEKQKMVDLFIEEMPKEFDDTIEYAFVDEEDEYEFADHLFVTKFAKIFCTKFISLLHESDQNTQSHYLPAVRGGIMQIHRTLVSTVIEQAPMAGLDGLPSIPPFTGVLSDFMKKLINVSDRSARIGIGEKSETQNIQEIQNISIKMEERIMGGKIKVQSSASHYPDFRYEFKQGSKNHDLPLMSTSSMVSELAPVSLFIRHYIRKGDLFILEEPEAHLHPGAQRAIANTLVQLVNAGVYVLITTHSSDILEQISNYVYAAEVDEKIKNQSLGEEKLTAYLFDKTSNNTVVKKVQFDADMGIVTQDHLDVSSALYNETVSLFEKRDGQG